MVWSVFCFYSNMKNFCIITLFLFSFSMAAQKTTVEVIDAQHITAIQFDSEEVYKITVKTAPVNEISLTTRTEGEYYNNISLDTEIRGNTLYLKSRFRESLQGGFDKLSAHKIFVMEVELTVPEGLDVEIVSNVGSTYLTGRFSNVFLELKNGSAYLDNFRGNAVINTYDGNIEVQSPSVSVEAESRHGFVEIPIIAQGVHHLKLKSINGNIKVTETK